MVTNIHNIFVRPQHSDFRTQTQYDWNRYKWNLMKKNTLDITRHKIVLNDRILAGTRRQPQ